MLRILPACPPGCHSALCLSPMRVPTHDATPAPEPWRAIVPVVPSSGSSPRLPIRQRAPRPRALAAGMGYTQPSYWMCTGDWRPVAARYCRRRFSRCPWRDCPLIRGGMPLGSRVQHHLLRNTPPHPPLAVASTDGWLVYEDVGPRQASQCVIRRTPVRVWSGEA